MLAPGGVVSLTIGDCQSAAVDIPRKTYSLVVVVKPADEISSSLLCCFILLFSRLWIIVPFIEAGFFLSRAGRNLGVPDFVKSFLHRNVGIAEIKISSHCVLLNDIFSFFIPNDFIICKSTPFIISIKNRLNHRILRFHKGCQPIPVDRSR